VRGEEVCCAALKRRPGIVMIIKMTEHQTLLMAVCVCGVEWLRRCMVHGGADQISLSLSAALECTKAERVHAQRARNKGERTL
jgi:hypothetical protein